MLLLGDVSGAVTRYDRCLASTATGADLDAVRHDAAINRQYALEQVPPSITPQGESERDPAASKQQRRPSGTRKRPDGGNTPDDGTPPEQENQSGGGNTSSQTGDRPPPGRRRVGGAGGASKAPPGSAGETPDDRLDQALDQIRDAQERRLPEEPPQEAAADGRKDW